MISWSFQLTGVIGAKWCDSVINFLTTLKEPHISFFIIGFYTGFISYGMPLLSRTQQHLLYLL